jgi:GTP pyrophosphokinase
LDGEEELMYAIGAAKLTDGAVMEALVPGCTADLGREEDWTKERGAISIRGLSPGAGFQLSECCCPVPGDRIVGLRKPDQPVEVHNIECLRSPTAWMRTGATCLGVTSPRARLAVCE